MSWHEFMNLALINSDANCDQQPLRVLRIIEHAQHACIITHFFAWGYANCQKNHTCFTFSHRLTSALLQFAFRSTQPVWFTRPLFAQFASTSMPLPPIMRKASIHLVAWNKKKLYHVAWNMLMILVCIILFMKIAVDSYLVLTHIIHHCFIYSGVAII